MAAVGRLTLLRVRSNIRTPTWSSGRLICWLRAGWVMCFRRARVGSPTVKPCLLLLGALLLAGCSNEQTTEKPTTEAKHTTEHEPAPPAPPPDAGTQAGHGVDPGRVVVPKRDPSPPAATITLALADGTKLAETSQPGKAPQPRTVILDEPTLRGTTTGHDANGGVARVRVSLWEKVECRKADRAYHRLRRRYFPPPQTERIRSNPGARLPTRAIRSLRLTLSKTRCGAGRLAGVHGEVWGEAINGSGLEAVTPHLRFVYEAD
jgi:hypothetical protein